MNNIFFRLGEMMAVSAASERNFNYLRTAAFIFTQEKIEEGKRVFALVCREPRHDEWGVYHFLWIVKGSPSGIRDYGRICFHDIHGLSATGREKALAIHRHLIARGTFTEFIPSPFIERFYVSCGILHPSSTLIETSDQEEPDCDLIRTIGSVAVFSIGILATVGGVLMIFRGGAPPRELPNLAGHVMVGGGHFHFTEAVQKLGNVITQVPVFLQEPRMRSVPRISASHLIGSSNVVNSGERVSRIANIVSRGGEMGPRGIFDPNVIRWQSTAEYDDFEYGLYQISEALKDLSGHIEQTKLDSIREHIENLRNEMDNLTRGQAITLLEAFGEAAAGAFVAATAQGFGSLLSIPLFRQSHRDFLEFGNNGQRLVEIGREIENLTQQLSGTQSGIQEAIPK